MGPVINVQGEGEDKLFTISTRLGGALKVTNFIRCS